MPSIRPTELKGFYESVLKSTKRTFELILATPFNLPDEIKNLSNVVSIKTFASPIVASQMAVPLCRGKLIFWTSDDSLLIEDSLDKNIDLLYSMGDDHKNVVVAKYYEGVNGTEKPLQPDSYFKINGSTWTSSQYVSDDYWIFNVAVMYRSFFEELGGWSTEYQACPYAYCDLAIRAQKESARVIMSDYPLLDCNHQQKDHAPIEVAQIHEDYPIYQRKFRTEAYNTLQTKIDINNWKNYPPVWSKRFRQ